MATTRLSDPPLDETNIPIGQWFCHSCQVSANASDNEDYISLKMENVSQQINKLSNKIYDQTNKILNFGSDSDTHITNVEDTSNNKRNPVRIIKKKKKLDPRDRVKCQKDKIVNSVNSHVSDEEKPYGSTIKSKKRKYIDVNENNENSKTRASKVRVLLRNCDLLLKSAPEEDVVQNSVLIKKTNPKNTLKSQNTDLVLGQDENIKRMFDIVIKEAARMNSKQFELTSDIWKDEDDIEFPGTDKDLEYTDLDNNDLIKQSARTCFYCRRCCLYGEMISCDYCPSHFHLNCLNPPMCYIANKKWICPLHPHNILDRIMEEPDSFTERLRWWGKFLEPVDRDLIENNFIINCKRKSKQRRITTLAPSYNSVEIKVPDIVKYHYKHPSILIPTLHQFLNPHTECVFRRNFSLMSHNEVKKSNVCCMRDAVHIFSDEDDESEVFRGFVLDNTDYIFHVPIPLLNQKCKTGTNLTTFSEKSEIDKNAASVPDKTAQEDSIADLEESILYFLAEKKAARDTILRNKVAITPKDELCVAADCVGDSKSNNVIVKCEELNNTDDFEVREANQINKMEVGLSNCQLVGCIKCCCVTNSEPEALGESYHSENLPDNMEEIADWKGIEYLIVEEINKLCLPAFRNGNINKKWKNTLVMELWKSLVRDIPPSLLPGTDPYPFHPPHASCEGRNYFETEPIAKVRAVLCPLTHRAPLIYIYNNTLSVGYGSENDVCLKNYGECNFISEKHAVIFFDKLMKCYEIINYSEYATVVDNVCYTCNGLHKMKQLTRFKITKTQNNSLNEFKGVCQLNKASCEKNKTRISQIWNKTNNTRPERRSKLKKAILNIDKLVSLSQAEMIQNAENDLKEIAQAIAASHHNAAAFDRKQKLVISNHCKLPDTGKTGSVPQDTGQRRSSRNKAALLRGSKVISAAVLNEDYTLESNAPNEASIQQSCVDDVIRNVKYEHSENDADVKNKKSVKSDMETYSTDDSSESSSGENFNIDEHDFTSDEECASYFEDKNIIPCKCQKNNLKLPYAHDSSWEGSAVLQHGSYIRFGCLEFVFSIVNYPSSPSSRYKTSNNTSQCTGD